MKITNYQEKRSIDLINIIAQLIHYKSTFDFSKPFSLSQPTHAHSFDRKEIWHVMTIISFKVSPQSYYLLLVLYTKIFSL